MPIEIEKKYRIDEGIRATLLLKLAEVGAVDLGQKFEENIIYRGGVLDTRRCVLRLRKILGQAVLTYKERLESESAIKHQREEETSVADADATEKILAALGYEPSLVYEKRRHTFQIDSAEIVIDELPFGWFVEIEADEDSIRNLEQRLGLQDATPVLETYPFLTSVLGEKDGDKTEARFSPT